MILEDRSIVDNMRKHVTPWLPDNVNPASLDLRLGKYWIDISGKKPLNIISNHITLYPPSLLANLLNMLPGRRWRRPTLLLATTYETIEVPPHMYAMVKLKTTPCREGLGHPIADWIDPGFRGQLTLMLHAFKPIDLHYKQRICQIVFGLLAAPSVKPYNATGHYMNQNGPTLSWREAYVFKKDMG